MKSFIVSGSTRPVTEIAPAASTRPISIEPESPMKIRAGCMLCGRNPRHMPIRITVNSVAGAAASIMCPYQSRYVYRKNAAAAMHTMPAARPSRPSTKLTALMVMTTRATVSSVPCHWVSATVPTPGIGSHRIVRPWMTMTAAAIICPPSLIRASISNLSSSTPISQISAAPESSALGSVESWKTQSRLWRWAATISPAHSPPNMAMPPSLGVGSRWTSRARIAGIAPIAMANLRTGPVSR